VRRVGGSVSRAEYALPVHTSGRRRGLERGEALLVLVAAVVVGVVVVVALLAGV